MPNEGEENRSPKRKVIGLESEETQDYVREGKSTISVPLKPLFRCDKQCSEKTLSYWQHASVVVSEGDEAYTTNLCQKCVNKHLQAKRKRTTVKRAVETGGGKEGVSCKSVENDG